MSFVIIATMLPLCKIILNFIRMSFVHTRLCYYLHFFLTSSEGALTASLSLSLFCRTLSSMNFSGTLSPRIGVLRALSTLYVWIILEQSVYNLSYSI